MDDAPLLPDRPPAPSKAERLFRLAALLRGGPLSVQDLAGQLYAGADVNADKGGRSVQRVIQRDLADLARLDPDFRRLPGRPPRYTTGPAVPAAPLSPTHLAPLQLSGVELVAVYAAAQLMEERAPGSQRHGAQVYRGVLAALRSGLPERLLPLLPAQDTDTRRHREDLNLSVAAGAWLGGHPLRFEYRWPGSGGWRGLTLEPYLIRVQPATLALDVIGLERDEFRAVRRFRLAQMRNVQVLTEETYHLPSEVQPDDLTAATAAEAVNAGPAEDELVRLRFTPQAAPRLLGGNSGPLEEPDIRADGQMEARFQAALDPHRGAGRELMDWLLSFGAQVEVLEPLQLRAQWADELRAALAVAEGT